MMEHMRLGLRATEEVLRKMNQEAEGFDTDGFPILSGWGFYNLLTWHISRNTVSLNHRVEMENRLRAAIGYFNRNRFINTG